MVTPDSVFEAELFEKRRRELYYLSRTGVIVVLGRLEWTLACDLVRTLDLLVRTVRLADGEYISRNEAPDAELDTALRYETMQRVRGRMRARRYGTHSPESADVFHCWDESRASRRIRARRSGGRTYLGRISALIRNAG